MNIQELVSTAQALVHPKKGILAADESSGTIKKRFDMIDVESTEETRRDYREMLFRTKGIKQFISGVILFDETMRQNGNDGTSLVRILQNQGIIPGIKVDKSGQPLAGAPGEQITEGLDGLRARCTEYYKLGARFTKWRALITIGGNIPSSYCITANAQSLARFATLSQEAGLVPIIEPEVLMDGNHNIDRCFEATESTLREVYFELGRHQVHLEGTLLKPNMVLSGKDASNRAGPSEVAKKTLACLKRTVPAAVPGIVFLSGGQTDKEATVNLDMINRQASIAGAPWQLSFSYGRGLQAAPLKAWSGHSANVKKTQDAFYKRAWLTSAAREGDYTQGMGKEANNNLL